MKKKHTEIKNIISTFIKIPVDNISENTIIDKTVVQGSILIHRMYAEIADIGYNIENYNNIRSFADLLQKTNHSEQVQLPDNQIIKDVTTNYDTNNSIGIDIEELSNFKTVEDYRDDNFYKQNFSEQEIAHCLLQENILQSFAGKFAAKEAIVKADNSLINNPFNKIEVLNDKNGKPFFQNLVVSISHTNKLTIAVAMQINNTKTTENKEIKPTNNKIIKYLSVAAIIISTIALATIILQNF